MSRSTSRDNSSSVSLFPFLAVLLCTMGGLVVLLVAVSHVSRELAKQEKAKVEAAAATQAAPDEHALAQLAELRRRSDEYARREAEAKDSVRQDRLRLAQVEQHVRKLQDEMEMIQVAARELEADESQRYDDRAQAERELARLEQLIDDTKLEIEQQRKQTEGEKKSYAVVPYKGASGTQRQPIYIECRADRVLLQPEGIELTPDDFATPLGVGNPLAAALRAARDHMVRNTPSAGDDADAEPYPLILIRPEGIGAYYRVREAIRSWDADFGYEMIDGDWDLSFAPPDAQLANVELRAIDNARLRREVLASAAPSAFSGGGGTFAIPAEDEPLSDEYPYDPAMLGGGGTGGGGATLVGHGGGGSYSGRSNGPGSGGGGHPSNSRSGHPGQGQTGQGEPGQGQPGQPGQQWQAGQLGATGWSTGGAPSRAEEGYPEGSSGASLGPGGASPHQRAGAESGGQSQTQGGDSGQPSSDGHPGGSVNGSVAGAAGGGQSSSAGAGGGAASASGSSMGAGGSSGAVASLNDKKGPDDVAIRRAVKVSVFADRLLVGGQAEPLPMPGPTSAHINDFVASVKQQIQSWGLAGSGLYWRPIIKLDVRQGGEQRAAEIERILTRSGIDIEPVQTANLTDREPTSVTR